MSIFLSRQGGLSESQVQQEIRDMASKVQRWSSGVMTDHSTITNALSGAVSGDSIRISPGLYNERPNVPAGVYVTGIGPARDIIIAGDGTDNPTVTLNGTSTIREVTVYAPLSGSSPAIDCTNIGAGSIAVIFNTVLVGRGGNGNGVTKSGSGELAILQGFYHNGGSLGSGSFIEIQEGELVLQEIIGNVGSCGTFLKITSGSVEARDFLLQKRSFYNCDTGIEMNEGYLDLVAFENSNRNPSADTCLKINGEDIEILMKSCNLKGQTSDIEISSGLTGSNAIVGIVGSTIRRNRITNNSGPEWLDAIGQEYNLLYLDRSAEEDSAFRFESEIGVGTPDNPRESSLGEGDSTNVNMYIMSYDGVSNYVDLTETLKSRTNSSASIFQGTGSGNILYIGSSERRFPAMKATVVSTQSYGSGGGNWEFSSGPSSWTSFDVMERDDKGSGTSYGNQIFQQLSSTTPTKINFCTIGSSPNWVTSSINGTGSYWLKYELTGAINQAAVLERIKLSTNSVEIDNFGETFHGTTRPFRKLLAHLSLSDDLSGASPLNGSVAYSSNITLTPIDNRLSNGQDDGFGLSFQIPKGLDTSSPLTVRFGFYGSSNTGNEFKAKFYHTEAITVGTNVNTNTVNETLVNSWDTKQPSGATLTGSYPAIENNTANQLYIAECQFSVPKAVPGDTVAVALKREDSTDGDTYAGSITVCYFEIEGRFWN